MAGARSSATCDSCARARARSKGCRRCGRISQAWLPPEPELGFTIVQKPADRSCAVALVGRRRAAGVGAGGGRRAGLAAGAAIANLQVRYGNDGLTVTTGWMSARAAARAAVPAAVAAPSTDWRPALVALEQSLRSELAQMRRTGGLTATVRTRRPNRRATTPPSCGACRRWSTTASSVSGRNWRCG